MKLTLLLCLVALAIAAPQHSEKDATILVDQREDHGDGNFNYHIETSNDIVETRSGTPGSEGQSNMDGYISFILEDGTPAELTYIADENGYRPSSDLLPVGPPIPDFALKQIEFAERERQSGK